jgi:hypothetical protein
MNALHTEVRPSARDVAALHIARGVPVATAGGPDRSRTTEDPELMNMRYQEARARLELEAVFTEGLMDGNR